jgi:hypothetical protein
MTSQPHDGIRRRDSSGREHDPEAPTGGLPAADIPGDAAPAIDNVSARIGGMDQHRTDHPQRGVRPADASARGRLGVVEPVRGAQHQGLPVATDELRRSSDPAVVLSSLARACVPSFCDGCALELSEGLEPVVRVSYPMAGDDPAGEPSALSRGQPGPPGASPDIAACHLVVTSFQAPSAFGQPSFAGIMVHRWQAREPTPSDAIVARLLVDNALAMIQHERLAEVAAQSQARAAFLAVEAMTSRAIGEATGIVMATRHLSSSVALDLLRATASQAGRTLHEVALEVVHAGRLDDRSERPVGRARRGGNLRTVS